MIGSLFKGMLLELDGLGINRSMLDSGNGKSKGGFSEINWELLVEIDTGQSECIEDGEE